MANAAVGSCEDGDHTPCNLVRVCLGRLFFAVLPYFACSCKLFQLTQAPGLMLNITTGKYTIMMSTIVYRW
jgi:hypothetical protein